MRCLWRRVFFPEGKVSLVQYEQIKVEVDGPIASLILARPAVRNAMSAQMGAEVQRAVAELSQRRELRAVLVRGEGAAFAAGGDLGFIDERVKSPAEENRRAMLAFYRLFLSIRELPVPSIAVLHGPAIGAGMCFAAACDLRVAAPGVQLGFNFVRLGLHPGMGATWLLPRLVGMSRASELLLSGRLIGAEEAWRIGLVDAVHPPEQLLGAAKALAAELASAAPGAVARTKVNLRRAFERTLDEALEAEASAQALDFGGAALSEGLAALRERRPPLFP